VSNIFFAFFIQNQSIQDAALHFVSHQYHASVVMLLAIAATSDLTVPIRRFLAVFFKIPFQVENNQRKWNPEN